MDDQLDQQQVVIKSLESIMRKWLGSQEPRFWVTAPSL